MEPTVRTVLGGIKPQDLGCTLMHEHLITTWPAMRLQYPELYDDEAALRTVVSKLKEARSGGVQTVVDLTLMELGRNVEFMRRASEESGVHVIAATGLFHWTPLYFQARTTAKIAEFMVQEIREGIGKTGIRPGIIKVATQYQVDKTNERVLRAAARAHRETGVPIYTHSHAMSRTGLDQQRILREQGVDLGRVVIGHSDDTSDEAYIKGILDGGSYCGLDRFGIQEPRTTEQRVETVVRLIDEGYTERLILSHDSCAFTDMAPEGFFEQNLPTWSFTHIPNDVVPMMKAAGVPDATITQIMVENPRRFFERNEPY